ncbi:phage tail protein [Acinetobacter bereziniae]|uniref:phage tail protein n=1 Tax=Acinetobacter bereziniae TaxID=106648 RepID=UPI0015DA5781|nr:phage tail protein [Acinetobacter bereziniae]
MSNRLFEHCTDFEGNSATTKFKVLSNQFGDGYEQHVSVGINNKKGEWAYQRTSNAAEILEIKQFFDDHKGADSFLWQHPKHGLVRVKTDVQYQEVKLGGDIWRISTTFYQQF